MLGEVGSEGVQGERRHALPLPAWHHDIEHFTSDVREDDDHQRAEDRAGDLGGTEQGVTAQIGEDAKNGFQWEKEVGLMRAG